MKLVLLGSRKISLLNCVFLAGCGFCIIEGSKINKFKLNKIAARWPAWAVAQFFFSDK